MGVLRAVVLGKPPNQASASPPVFGQYALRTPVMLQLAARETIW